MDIFGLSIQAIHRTEVFLNPQIPNTLDAYTAEIRPEQVNVTIEQFSGALKNSAELSRVIESLMRKFENINETNQLGTPIQVTAPGE